MKTKFFKRVLWLMIPLLTIFTTNVWGETLFSQTGTSGYSIPDGWSNSGTSTGSYLGFTSNGAYLTSPLYEPHDNLSLAYTVACYGSGTNHPLVIQLLDENGTVKQTHTTGTPTSTTYINTNSPWSIGNINYKFKIKFYLASASKGVRLRNFTLTGDAVSDCEDPDTDLEISASATTIYTSGTSTLSTTGGNGSTVTYSVTSDNDEYASIVGTTFSATRAGTYTVQASQEEDGGVCGGTATVDITVRYQVKWSVNGNDAYTTGSPTTYIGTHDTKVTTLPTTPASGLCDGSKVFVGWTKTPIVGTTNTVPSDLFTTVAGSPSIIANTTFYAVFATSATATFTASDITNTPATGNTREWGHTASGTLLYLSDGQYYTGGTPYTWTVTKGTSNYARFTAGTNKTITQIVVTISGTNYKINSVTKGSLSTSSTTQTITGINSSTVDCKATSSYQIRITQAVVTYVSAFATSCCTPLGTINGSVSLSQLASPDPTKLKATWTMNASTGISSYNLEVYNSSDVLVKTINGYTSGSEITGLTPCTTYYVKLYTVSSGGEYCDGGLISTSSTVTTNGYTLNVSKTNVSFSSGSEPSNICSDVSATYSASVGYVLPSTITVTNAGAQNTGWTWNSSTGVLTINKASVTGNVTVTITGVEQGCSGQYTFAYGATPNADGKNIDGATKECFSQVGETTEYQITGFTIPTTTQYYWVGYNGSFYNDGLGSNNASSSRNQFKYMPVANLQGSSCGGTGEYYKHAATGAYGTLRIYSNYSDNNLYVGFSPAGYQMRVGSGESWSNIELTRVSSTSVWKSDIMDMSAALIAKNYYVNVWTSGSYSSSDVGVAINNWTDGGSTISSMQRKTNSGESYASGVTATMRGFFRVWTDNCANNGYAHFVPVHRVIYDANWPSGVEPAATYSSDVSVEESGNITVPAAPSAPTGYHFVEWNTAENGSGTGYAPGDTYTISAGASADVTLYAKWSNTTAITLSKGSQGTANGSAVGTYGSNTVGSFTAVTYGGTTYRLKGYSKSGTPSEIVIDASGNFVANTTYTDASGNWTSTLAEVTLVAQWQRVYTITWMSNGAEYTSGSPVTRVDAESAIGTLPSVDPTSCSATYSNFVGWFPVEAGSEGDPTAAASVGSLGAQVTTSTVPTGNTTYYAVFADGDPSACAYSKIQTLGGMSIGDVVVLVGSTTKELSGPATNSANSTAISDGCPAGVYELEVCEGYASGKYAFKNGTNYLAHDGTNKKLNTQTYVDAASSWTVSFEGSEVYYQVTLTNCSSGKVISFNNGDRFLCYDTEQTSYKRYLYKKTAAATGYISSCGTSISITNGEQHITSANGVWVQSQNITLTGTRMLDQTANAKVRVVCTSNNDKFRVKWASTSGQGTTTGVTLPYSTPQTYITTSDWTEDIAVTYTPTSANTTESATITVAVKDYNTSSTIVSKTFTVYGRSLPANFLIAVNDGTLGAGHWYAIPADMVAPYGSSCSSGLGTYKPIPITVDDNSNPTKATIAPARAVYQPVERSTPNTSPQTLRFKSKTLSGGTTYYLYGGGTGGDANNNNTHIQNASFADSEKQKWFLETEDLEKYTVHLASTITPNVLGYSTAGGTNRVGQYSSGSSTTKSDIWFLPFDVSECTYFQAPTVTPVSLDETNYTVQFTVDRGATAWQISTNGGSTWTDLGGVTLTGSCDPQTTAQVALPLTTYRGQTVDLKVKSASVCSEQKTTFTVPNPVITVTTPWHLYGVADAAFDNSEKSITLSGLYTGDGASTTVTSSNPNIHAELVAPVTNGEVAVRLTMTAGNATEGDHTATLTFRSTGAADQTVALTITMQDLAVMTITPTNVSSNLFCLDGGSDPSFTFSPIYVGGVAITSSGSASMGTSAFNVVDLDNNNATVSANYAVSSGAVTITINRTKLSIAHRYKISYTNSETHGDKTSTGIGYADAAYTFTAVNCSSPTALAACPVATTSFTANWVDDNCTGTTTIEVFKMNKTEITNVDFRNATSGATSSTAVAYGTGMNNSKYDNQWLYGGYKDGSVTIGEGWNSASTPNNGQFLAKSNGYKYWFSPKMNILVPSMTSSTIFEVEVTAYHYTTTSSTNTIRVFVMNSQTTTALADGLTPLTVSFNGESGTEWTGAIGSNETKTYKFTVSGLSGTNRLVFCTSSKVNTTYLQRVKISTSAKTSSTNYYETSCANKSKEITGLSSGDEYYYTVTNNGNTSNEVKVELRDDDPAIDFSPAKAVLQTESGGTTSTTIGLDGTNLTLCELAASITGTNADLFGYDLSEAIYNQTTGTLSGSLTITYSPTAEGTHTATLTIDGVELELEGHSCPAGFETMATAATSITKNSATANWSQTTTGFLMLAENQRMNTELLINGGFEQDGLGWDGIPSAMMPSRGSRQTAICTSGAKTGSKCAIMSGYGSGSYLYPYGVYSGTSTLGAAIYGEKQTLPAGTYTISAYLHNASTSSELQNTNYGGDCNVYLGVAVDCPSSMYATARRSLNDPTGQNINGKGASWFQVSETFTLEEPTSCYIYLAYKTSGPSYFAVDDVSLQCTGIVPGNNFEEKPITSATSLVLTDLKPSTSYSYYIVSETGCESNIISFTTLPSDDPVTVSATPNPVNLTAPLGGGSGQLVTITQENAYSDIFLAVGDCGGRITLSQSSVSSSGGAVSVNFSPLPGDAMGDHGSCTVTMSTLGMASSSTFTVNWTVSSGKDINTPTIEVVDISNEGMTIEHNIEKVSETSSVIIDLSRERDPATVEENAGDEIFFSKYYEAYQHKKILAIYNPTNHDISLANTYIWRSKGSSAGDKTGWNQVSGISLASYGKTTGVIAPKEEIILYNNQLTYTCEQSKTDMSGWSGTAEQAIYFDGDDAFLLVRKNIEGTSDDPPTESVTGDPLTWREYQDEDEINWWMLDLIGARTKSNDPDGSNLNRRWSWRNCKTSANEDGDEAGWIGYGYDVNDDAWSTNTCNSQPAGYLLSTNRCLLIRRFTVKSGNNAVAVNVGDMYTLGKGGQQSEWKGAHVPTEGDQAQVSCENFSFVGGYDYAGYYNAWTDMTTPDDYLVGSRNPDGSYTISGMNMPQYWCNSLRIKVVEHETVNGVEVDNVRHYQDYKVPIVVDENSNTANAKFFGNPNNPTYDGAEDNFKKANWSTECATCDVVVRDNVTLTRDATSGSKTAFRNIQVYPGAKLMVTAGQAFDLNGVEMRADNNEVSYAIINDDGSTITVDSVTHVKRIDDSYWYAFSLPYDCDVVSIRQLNGKSMGTYDDGVVYGTWTIKEYDGEERQSMDDFAGAGSSSRHWKVVPANGTLQKHKGYIIGLYETEWAGQHKSVFFPPKTSQFYTENGGDSKTATVHSWAANNAGAKKMNKGWNFVGLPYISLYNPQNVNGHGINNTSVMITGSFEDDYADQDHVYVSLPTDAAMKYYTQSLAGNTKLKPFSAYFVQVDGETDQNRTITYYKSDRTLSAAPRRARAEASSNQRIGFELLIGPEETQDRTGILLSDDYTLDYEIGRDMYKMTTSGDKKPHIWSVNPSSVKMAYTAMPMANGTNIPLGIYLPAAGAYTLTKDQYSDVSNVEAIYLLRDGEIVADLLFNNYDIVTSGAVTLSNYAIRVVAAKQVPTDIDVLPVDGSDWNSSTPKKFIYKDQLYILRGGNIYDATGKQVREIK